MKNYNFTMLPNEVLDVFGPQIGMAGYAVYCALARFAQGSGQCWPSQDTLANQLGTTRKTIRAALKKLQDAGLIAQAHRYNADGQTSNAYRLTAIEKRPEAAPTDGVADPPKPEPESDNLSVLPAAADDAPGDYEPHYPDEESHTAPIVGGDVEVFRTDEDVLIAIDEIRQANRAYLRSLLEDDNEGWPTDDDYPVDDSHAAEDQLTAA